MARTLLPRPPVGSDTEAYRPTRRREEWPTHDSIETGVRLQVLQTRDASDGISRTLTRFPCTVGREGCDVNFRHDPDVSRQHAEIALRNGSLMLIDHGSHNGTNVDNERLTPALPRILTGSTIVRLGKSTFAPVGITPICVAGRLL